MIGTIKSSSISLLAAMLGAEVRAFEHGLEENRRMEPRAEKPNIPEPLPDYRRIQAKAETKLRTLAMADIERFQAAQAKRLRRALKKISKNEGSEIEKIIVAASGLPQSALGGGKVRVAIGTDIFTAEVEMQDNIKASGV